MYAIRFRIYIEQFIARKADESASFYLATDLDKKTFVSI